MPYLGKSPSQGVRTRFQFTPNAGTTSISGADANGLTLSFTDGNYVDVYLNGVMLKAGVDYNTNTANTIAGLSATVASDVVDIVVYDTFSLFGGTLEGNVKVNNGTFNVTGAGDFDSTLNVDGVVTANAGVVVDNITIDGTEIDLSSGNLTIDVANDIILDSGDGDIQLKDTGSTFLNIYESSDHAYLYNPRSNGDIIFQGNGVSEALRLDMSNLGFATFNANATFNETGNDVDFRIESVNSTHMLFVDAGNNAVGIGENDPSGYPSNTQTGDTSGKFRIAGSVGSIAVSSTGNEIAFTRDSLNYISAPGTSAKINLRASTTGGVSLHSGATSFSAVSDETFKTITGNIVNASDKVKTLRTVMGRFNDEDESASHPFLIAQDVQKVLPEAVIFDKDLNKLLLSYTDVIPLLTASLKEALSKIETLETKIAKLEGE